MGSEEPRMPGPNWSRQSRSSHRPESLQDTRPGHKTYAQDIHPGHTPMTSADPATSLSALRQEAAHCHACPLWKGATQTVFGEGPQNASAMLVGEQPGDKEDLAGHPFVGPAGAMLDRALEEAGIDCRKTYVTNAVKHFKFVPRGKNPPAPETQYPGDPRLPAMV